MPSYSIVPSTQSLLTIRGISEAPLSAAAAQVLQKAILEEIVVDSDAEAWQLHIRVEDEVGRDVLDELSRAIPGCVGGVKNVAFVVRFGGEQLSLEKRVALSWDPCVKQLTVELPGLQAWVNGHWALQDNTVTVQITGELGLPWLAQNKVAERLSALLSEAVGCCLEVQFENGGFKEDEIQKLMERQVPEEKPGIDSSPKKAKETSGDQVLLGRKFSAPPIAMKEIVEEEKQVVVCGTAFSVDVREFRSGRRLVTLEMTDETDSITVKVFDDEKNNFAAKVAEGDCLLVRGPVQYDRFTGELTLMPNDVMKSHKELRKDPAPEKRIELHLHTKMSAMDALTDTTEVIKQAAAWGHPAVAITDHGVVQAFPEAYEAGKKNNIKVIFGLEGYLVEGQDPIVTGTRDGAFSELELVVFDLETTGLSARNDEIIEIGAVKIQGGEVIDRFGTFVSPGRPLSAETTRITGITDEMLRGAPQPGAALTEFLEFAGGAILVAHNADFDMGFLEAKIPLYTGRPVAFTYLDTLPLARTVWPDLKNHKLDTVAADLQIDAGHHHRAADDAHTAGQILLHALRKLEGQSIGRLQELNGLNQERGYEFQRPYHIVILVKDQAGLKNLYQIVSQSHLKYFHRQPRLPRKLLETYREGLILGSACESGELFQAVVDGADDARLESIAAFYDYLEVQPLGNNQFMLAAGRASSVEDLKGYNRRVIELGRRLEKPVVATGDVHFLAPSDEVYRRIILAGQGFEDADRQAPLYFHTTDEMLAEFGYLSSEDQHWVVIECPSRVAGMIEQVRPVPEEFFPPKIEGADDEIRTMSYERARALYGDPLPDAVAERIEWELKSIIGHGYAVLYLIAQKLVKKSLDDGYLVGSRGSVGSSLVATLCDITEVNPLPAHYLCPSCHYSEFMESGSIGSGVDLPSKDCPRCGGPLRKEGHDIPFATFMGFEGDKEPDIDLNFSGEYQGTVHKYTEELFGKDHTFRAGTITTLADKTAFGFVRAYLEERNVKARRAEMNRLVKGCTGVRRSTGQHPGGMMVIPPDKHIHDFTPVQFPANDKTAGWITTHFDYHSLSGRLVKLDILGHDDPTAIRMLHDLTGINPRTIPLDDPDTMGIFRSVEPLGVTAEQAGTSLGTLAIPEFGTSFVRQMLEDTKPTTFSELIMISGLSHGTGVWLGNAQDLIQAGTAKLTEIISARDDIMKFLIFKGVKPKSAFKIMESVRKGRGVSEDDEKIMKEAGVPDWYIASCRKISYLFPKAHATAYVMMSFRIAYFKVHHPDAFYATYFTVRAEEFDADMVSKGPDFLRSELKRLQAKGKEATGKEENLATILEVVLEAMARGIRFLNVDLYRSHASRFLITPEGLLPPLASLPGVGQNAAVQLWEAAREGAFMSVEDLKTRARLSSSVIETLRKHGCLAGMPESDQLSLFAV